MKILFAGATGAIGQPAVSLLVEQGHEVYGITSSQDHVHILEEMGANPVILDVLDREAVSSVVAKSKPVVIIDMLTRLPKEYTPTAMQRAAEMNAKIRIEGGAHLQGAAKIHGVKRYITQSSGFFYAPGTGLADEKVPLAFEASPGVAAGSRMYAEIEKQVLQERKLLGIALRFGFFYGPGTWFEEGESIAEQVMNRQLPVVGNGRGVWSFIHIDDAAKAIVAALQLDGGAYNVVDDDPSPIRDWLPAYARFLGVEPPLNITEEEAKRQSGPDVVYYATKLRGASNAKAKAEFDFQPRPLEWL